MNTRLPVSEDGSMTIRIPLTFRKRGGRGKDGGDAGWGGAVAAAGRQRDGQGAGGAIEMVADARRGHPAGIWWNWRNPSTSIVAQISLVLR